MTEYALQVISYIDPVLIEQAELSAPAGRRPLSRLRAAVIAACVCAVLLGTVGAVRLTGAFAGGKIQFGTDFSGYDFQRGGIEVVSKDAFRTEFLEAIEGREDGKLAYLNRAALEEAMGFQLPENRILQEMFQGRCSVRRWDNGLTFWEYYIRDDVLIDLRTTVYFSTDMIDQSKDGWVLYKGVDEDDMDVEHYEMPDGSTALILTITTQDQERQYFHYDCWFVWKGMSCSISTSAGYRASREEVRTLLENVLDAFD